MEVGHGRGLNPPVFFLAALVAVVMLAVAVPIGTFASLPFEVVGGVLFAVGIWLNIQGSGQFERAGTPIRPGSRGGALVTNGAFRLSRNPMYLGLASILFGAALSLGSAIALVVTPVFILGLDRGFVSREEVILEEEFGEAYRAYRGRVRRWL